VSLTGTVTTPAGDNVALDDVPLYVVVLVEDGKPCAHIGGTACADHPWTASTLRLLAADADRQARRAGER
jgi:hypothetical protein